MWREQASQLQGSLRFDFMECDWGYVFSWKLKSIPTDVPSGYQWALRGAYVLLVS